MCIIFQLPIAISVSFISSNSTLIHIMDSSRNKSNKIRDIVRLQQILKKWKKLANNNNNNNDNRPSGTNCNNATTTNNSNSSSKSINKFLKKTLSFSESSLSLSALSNSAVPKGYVAVCVGKELKRFVIPTEYLGHQVFGVLLREAEEEFGFQQEGVLKFPCEVDLFEKILKMMENKRSSSSLVLNDDQDIIGHDSFISSYSVPPDTNTDQLTPSSRHHPQMCR